MRGQRTKKVHHTCTGVHRHVCPGHVSPPAGGRISKRNLVDSFNNCHCRLHSGCRLSDMAKQCKIVEKEWAL